MATETVGILRVLLTANSAEFETAMKKAADSAKVWSKDLAQIGRQAQDVGMALTKTLTLPIVGLAGTSIKAASDFESSFAGIRKTVNDATDAMGNLTPVGAALAQGMRDLALTIPVNVNELNKIGEAAGQLGIKSENILGFTRVMADLGVTTNLSSDEAATALARLANITQMPQDQFDRLGSTIVGLGNNFATTEAEIVEFGLRIAGAGQLAGLSEHQILAIGTAMSSVGVQAEAGGTAVQKVLNAMTESVATGGKKLEKFASVAGMSAQEFADAYRKDAAGAFNSFVQGLGAQGDQAFATLNGLGLSNERVIRAFLSLANAGDLLTDTLNVGSQSWEENSALTKEAEQRYNTFESQLALFWAQVRDVGIEIGQTLVPVLKDLIESSKPVLQWAKEFAERFAALPEGARMSAFAIGAFTAAMGPAVWIGGQFVTALSQIIAAFGLKGIAMRGIMLLHPPLQAEMVATTAAARTMWTALAGPVGLVAGVGVAWAAMKGDWTRFFDAVIPPLGFLRAGLDDLNKTQNEARKTAAQMRDSLVGLAGGLDATVEKLLETSGAIRPLTRDMKDLNAANTVWGKGVEVAETATFGFREELALTRRQVAELTKEERSAIAAGDELGKSTKEIAEALGLSEAAINLYKQQVSESAKSIEKAKESQKKFLESIRATAPAFVPFKAVINDAGSALQNIAAGFEADGTLIVRTLHESGLASKAASEAMQDWAAKNGSVVTPSIQAVGSAVEDTTKKTSVFSGILDNLGDTIVRAFQGGSNVLKSIGGTIGKQLGDNVVTRFGERVTGALGQTLGSAINAIIPGIGTLLGPLMSRIGGFFKGLFGGVSPEVQKARQEVDAFQAALQKTATSAQVNEAAGRSWALTLITVRDEFLRIGKTASEAELLVAQMLNTDRPDAARAAMEKLNAVMAGGQLEAELLDEAIREYGFSIEELGPKFQAQRLSEQAQRLVEHYAVLIESGIEQGVVTDRMSEKTQEFLTTALRTNAEIPRSMEPMLALMVEQGLLTDENGEKLTDLSRLTWAESMTQGFDRVVGAVERLIQALTGIPKQIGIEVVGTYIPPDIPGVDVGFASGTMGRLGKWMADFGQGTTTVLHGKEMVVPQAQIPALFGDMLSAASPALSSGPALPVPGIDVSSLLSELRGMRRLLSDLPSDIKLGYKAAMVGA